MAEIWHDEEGVITEINGVTVGEFLDYEGDSHAVTPKIAEIAGTSGMWHFNRSINETLDQLSENGWAGLGMVLGGDMEPFQVMEKDDYGRPGHAGIHLCEAARRVSNTQAFRAILEAAQRRHQYLLALEKDCAVSELDARNTELFWENDGYLFYDLGSAEIVKAVLSAERALSDYPLLDEDGHSELEHDWAEELFHNSLPSLDASVDSETLWDAYKEENEGLCPECGTKDVTDFLNESPEYVECADCADWFSVDEDDVIVDKQGWEDNCGTCAEDVRGAIEEADEKTDQLYDFEVSTGKYAVIRWTDGFYYQWLPTQGPKPEYATVWAWVKIMKTDGTKVLNENKQV